MPKQDDIEVEAFDIKHRAYEEFKKQKNAPTSLQDPSQQKVPIQFFENILTPSVGTVLFTSKDGVPDRRTYGVTIDRKQMEVRCLKAGGVIDRFVFDFDSRQAVLNGHAMSDSQSEIFRALLSQIGDDIENGNIEYYESTKK